MHQEAKKGMFLTLGAIGLVMVGALLAVLILKFIKAEPAPVTPAPAVAQETVEPVPATPAMAQITSVQPHYSIHSYPTRVCHDEPRSALVRQAGTGGGSSGLGAVVGGIAGGALGNQVGHGRGRTAATIGGVVLGALAGNQVEGNMNQPPPAQEEMVMVRVCHTRTLHKSVVTGYDVGYVYNGQPATILMKSAPVLGSTLPLTSLQAN